MMETWKKIPGLPEYYEASSAGRVRTLARRVERRGKGVMFYKGVVLKPFDDGRYLKVTADRKTQDVHRLVLAAFSGPVPFSGAVCRHLNGNSKDNRAENLAWGSHEQNQMDRFDHGTALAGESHCRTRTTEAKVLAMMELRNAGKGPKAIADATGCSIKTVEHVLYGESWNWLTNLPRKRYGARKEQASTSNTAVPAVQQFFDIID